MNPPFTTEQFFNVFEKYNSTLFPAQIIILILGIIAVLLIYCSKAKRNIMIGGFLGFLWMWIGLAYHIAFFTAINKAANIFGALFILQGLLFLFVTLFRKKLDLIFKRSAKGFIGYFFIIFGLILYPIISYFTEGSLDRIILLGLPCPTTIFTFGFLMLASGTFPRYLLIIPTIWAIVGTSAAINFDVYQDYVMIVSAVTADIFILFGRK